MSSFYLHSDFGSETYRTRTKEEQGWLELLERVGFDVLYRMVNEPRLPPQLSVSIYPHSNPTTHIHTQETKGRKTKPKKVQHKKGRQKEVIFLTCRHPKQNDASVEFQITFSVSQTRDERGLELPGVWV